MSNQRICSSNGGGGLEETTEGSIHNQVNLRKTNGANYGQILIIYL